MSDEEFLDPYVYPGTTVLRNLLNETDAAALDQAEYELTFLRREELARHPLTGPFTLPRLQETHRRLFQDVYRWAGEIRTVEIKTIVAEVLKPPLDGLSPLEASVYQVSARGSSPPST
jgi:cell filamentation protein